MTAFPRTALSAIGSRPDDLKTFLKTLRVEGRARLRSAQPRPLNAISGGRGSRFAAAAFQPSAKEIVVAASVMIVTAALTLWAIVAAAS
jgi:hypothetical protein